MIFDVVGTFYVGLNGNTKKKCINTRGTFLMTFFRTVAVTVISRAYFMFQVFTVKAGARGYVLFVPHRLSLG